MAPGQMASGRGSLQLRRSIRNRAANRPNASATEHARENGIRQRMMSWVQVLFRSILRASFRMN